MERKATDESATIGPARPSRDGRQGVQHALRPDSRSAISIGDTTDGIFR